MPFSVTQIDHVEVLVRDLAAAARWYGEVLGLAERHRWDPEPVMIGREDGPALALFQASEGRPPPAKPRAGTASPGAPTPPASLRRKSTCAPLASPSAAPSTTTSPSRSTSRTPTATRWRSRITVERVPVAAARRLLLDAQGLLADPRRRATTAAVYELVERMGFVQIDSINVVARAHHLILGSRLDGYRPALLDRLLERDRSLFEHWTHDAAAVPTAWFPYWRHASPTHARSSSATPGGWRGSAKTRTGPPPPCSSGCGARARS